VVENKHEDEDVVVVVDTVLQNWGEDEGIVIWNADTPVATTPRMTAADLNIIVLAVRLFQNDG
jgi:hypothetical protein